MIAQSLLNRYAKAASNAPYNLAIGQLPDRLPRESIERMLQVLLEPDHGKYLPVTGSLDAREAVSRVFTSMGISVAANSCIIGNGAKSLVFTALMALREEVDSVIWFTPGYPPFERASHMAGLRTIAVSCGSPQFQPNLNRLSEALEASTCGVVIVNNPVNPTGRLWSRHDLEGISEIANAHGAFVLADETYGDFVMEGEFVPFASISGNEDYTITIRSGSKELRAPSYRLGYATGPLAKIDAMAAFAGECLGCPSFVADRLARMLPCKRIAVSQVIRRLRQNRQIVTDWCQINGYRFAPMEGGYFAFVHLPLADGHSGCEFATELLEAQGVGIIPGEAFAEQGQEGDLNGWFRISYATEEAILRAGLTRIQSCL